jgi:putative ABC transport system substrate-binding protein
VPAASIRRVGVLAPDLWDRDSPEWNEFVAELARRGYVEGRNLVFERRFGDSGRLDLLEMFAAELVGLKVDVIYATRGTAVALAAKRATTTTPIVFYSSADPVGMGLVASLPRPGGNLTGSSIQERVVSSKSLQFLAEAVGRLSGIAYVQPRGTRSLPWFPAFEADLTTTAKGLGATIEFFDVEAVAEIEPLVKRLVRQGVNAAMVEEYSLFRPQLNRIATLFVAHRLPTHGNARAGFLLHYQVRSLILARMAATKVDRILHGARPSELPIEQASEFELVVNLKTAKALGLTIPQSLLLRADEVIQ